MVAKKLHRKKESGQSMLEFALLLPILTGLFVLLIRVEMAISTAIVNQKYARNHMHFLSFNHRYYPEKKFLKKSDNSLMNIFWIGVSDKVHYNEEVPKPAAPTVDITLAGNRSKFSEDDQDKVEYAEDGTGITRRQKIRIRILSYMCTPPMGFQVDQYFTNTPGALAEDTFSNGRYQYCNN